ncbi:MAG TPA: hypothetical protein VNL77_22160 [Roseiflexaceae bacterium]|nr:hypothetical protein [Roseiflexaceae bacterium]
MVPTLTLRATRERAALVARGRALLAGAALFAAFCALLAFVQYGTPHLADNDGFYHMRMAQLMREQGLTPRFTWLPLTILDEARFYDHHMLYHVYLALFTGDGSEAALIAGAKAASVALPALAFTAIWWLLRGAGVGWAWAWALGLGAVSEAFLYRMSMPRAQSASLLMLALALHWLLRRRHALLLPLGFAYVWLYNAFPLLLLLAGAYAAASWLTGRRLEWRAPAYAAAGLSLGLLANPYFPANLRFIASHLAPKFGALESGVGNEWYPYQTWTLVENSGGALALWLLGVFALGWRGRRFDRATLTAFLLSVAFGLMLFKSRRFVEYFPPFALIFAALAIGGRALAPPAPLSRAREKGEVTGIVAHLPAPVATGERPGVRIFALLALAAMLALTLPAARETMARARPAETYADASRWLRANTPPGSTVFQSDWDDFPRLFFYNTANVYVIGLDPTYLQLRDARLFDEWVAISRGEVEAPGAAIRERFGASYAISDLRHTGFLRRAARDPRMREVYRDAFAVIFEIR